MTGIAIELDDRQLQAWAGQTVKAMTSALRSAVDKSARYARNRTIPIMAADSGVPAARFRNAVPTVKGATAANLSATWTIGKSPNFIRGAGGAVLRPVRGQGVMGSTFSLTGGGSASLSLPKAFAIPINGGAAVFIRTGKGRAAIRAIYAESPNTGMSQGDGAPRKAWEQAAGDAAALLISAAVTAALEGQAEPATPAKFVGQTL